MTYYGLANDTFLDPNVNHHGYSWFERVTDPSGYQNAVNSAEAAVNRQFQSAEADKARAWEERMSNTAYQRAAEDMKSAGLNPYLALSNGGASTPSSPSPSGYAAQVGQGRNVLGDLGRLALSAIFQAFSAKSAATMAKANERLIDAKIANMALNQQANSGLSAKLANIRYNAFDLYDKANSSGDSSPRATPEWIARNKKRYMK